MPVVGDPGGARLPRHFDADVAEVGGAEDGNRRRRIDVVVIVAVLDRHEEETSHLIEVAEVEVAEVGKRLWDANDLDSRGGSSASIVVARSKPTGNFSSRSVVVKNQWSSSCATP